MELAIGIEPTTCWLQVSCSTVEPCQHFKWRLRRGSNPRPPAWQAGTLTNWATEPSHGGHNRARTCDPLLVRQVLSQLSYATTMVPRRGIEPLFPEWKSDVLTTERTGHWCRLSESNQSPTDYKSVALPDELKRLMSFKDIRYITLFVRFCQQKF